MTYKLSEDDLPLVKLLTPKHEEILLATRELSPPSYSSLAIYLGAPVGTIKSRLSRAKAELRKQISRQQFVDSVKQQETV